MNKLKSLEALSALLSKDKVYDEDPAKEGFHSADEISRHLGLSLSRTFTKLHELRRDGKVEVRRYQCRTGAKPCPKSYYKIK